MKQYKYHSLARYFPMLPPNEFQKLKESIQQIGQLEPITLLDGKILDGRNRYEACKELGIEPDTREFGNTVEPLEFVFVANMRRRHLTEAQKAQIIIDIRGLPEPMTKAEAGAQKASAAAPAFTRNSLAEEAGVSKRTISRVAEVQDRPKIQERLRAGEVTATEAVRERMKEVADKAKITPTLAGMYARSPDTKQIMEQLSRVIGYFGKRYPADALTKIDPKGHTPLMIKRVDEAISALQIFKKKLEEIRDA